ncbi:unnamed protein product, partial [Clonostachys byssicola]
ALALSGPRYLLSARLPNVTCTIIKLSTLRCSGRNAPKILMYSVPHPAPQSDYILGPRHHPPQSHDVICRSTQRLGYPTFEVRSTSGQQNGYSSPISPFLQLQRISCCSCVHKGCLLASTKQFKQASLPLFGPGLDGDLEPGIILVMSRHLSQQARPLMAECRWMLKIHT